MASVLTNAPPVTSLITMCVTASVLWGYRANGMALTTGLEYSTPSTACRVSTPAGVVDLSSLQREDGSPRFTVQYKGWNYSFNPCTQYNLPKDPHLGQGDGCFAVLMCRWRHNPNKVLTTLWTLSAEFFTIGVLKSSKFMRRNPAELARRRGDASAEREDPENNANEEMDSLEAVRLALGLDSSLSGGNSSISGNDSSSSNSNASSSSSSMMGASNSSESESVEHPRGHRELVLRMKGIKTARDTKTYIHLVCDSRRVRIDDASFTVAASSEHNDDMYFQLRHRCCCPGACAAIHSDHFDVYDDSSARLRENTMLHPNGSLIFENGTYATVEEKQATSSRNDARHLWLVLVINVAVLTMAVVIATVCCRKGGGAPYGALPDYEGLRNETSIRDGNNIRILSAIHASSRMTMNSEESCRSVVKIHRPAPEYLDYSSSMHQKTQLPVLDNCIIPGHALEIGQRLGGGLFGDTYLSEWKDRAVAAKRFTVGVHQNQLNRDDVQWIVNQVAMLSKQRHRHLVAVLGICIDTRQPYVVNECVDGESLKDVLRKEDEPLHWPRRVKLCIQAADGMAFLHSHKPPILHRDLRSANLLVDLAKERLKVVDYGTTRLVQRLRQGCNGRKGCYCHPETSAYPASVRWTAPEILANPLADESQQHLGVFTTACDIYSFGVVMWEVATSAAEPYDDITDEVEIIEAVCDGYRPALDGENIRRVLPHYTELMKVCWDHNMDSRPNFKQVAMHMKNVQQMFSKISHRPRTRNESSTTSYLMSALKL